MARRNRTTRRGVRAMQVLIAGILGFGVLTGDPRVIVNAGLALGGTLIPTVLAGISAFTSATLQPFGSLAPSVFTVNATDVASDTPVSAERESTDKPTASAVGS